jgi:hypothetical protein
MKRILLTAIVLLTAGTGVAQAYTPGARDVDRRQSNQDRRIEAGIRDGSLTRLESSRLRAQQAKIAHLERMARRDGYVSPREAAVIRQAQLVASRMIWAERHDNQKRGYGRPFWR